MISLIGARVGSRPRFQLVPFLRTISVWQQRAKSRRLLAALPESALKDIGLSRAEAFGESQKPFWRE